jgi:hypothetical protein
MNKDEVKRLLSHLREDKLAVREALDAVRYYARTGRWPRGLSLRACMMIRDYVVDLRTGSR